MTHITGGAGDEIVGGSGSDSIVIDGGRTGRDRRERWPDLRRWLGPKAADQDTLDLTGFVAFRNLVETPDPDGDSTSGTPEVQNADGDWVPVTFAEIETLLLPPKAPDGVVDARRPARRCSSAMTTAMPPPMAARPITNDGDVIEGNGGDDTIDAAGGDDTVDGGTGDDHRQAARATISSTAPTATTTSTAAQARQPGGR